MFRKLEFGIFLGVLLNDFVLSDELIDLTESEPTLSEKIVNGLNVEPPFRYSWMASIQHGNHPYCGGVMIATNAMITARHCSIKGDNDEYKVLVHRHDLWKSNKEENGIELEVLERVYHPDADIALWKLSPSYNHTAEGIMLFPNGTDIKGPETGEIATALGWGRTGHNAKSAHILQEVRVPLVDPKKCESVWNRRRNVRFRSAIQVCAGWPEGERDTCKGDSGGPLFVMRGKVPMIVGLTSFGDPCAKPNTPTVYSKVEPFIEWIIKHMNNPITSTVKPVPGSSQKEISDLIQETLTLDDDQHETTDSSDESIEPASIGTAFQTQPSSTIADSDLSEQPFPSVTSSSLSPSSSLGPTSAAAQLSENNILDFRLDGLQEFINIFLEESKNTTQVSTDSIGRDSLISHSVEDLDLETSSKKGTSVTDSQLSYSANNLNSTQDAYFDLSKFINNKNVLAKVNALLESIEDAAHSSQSTQDQYETDLEDAEDSGDANNLNDEQNTDKNTPAKPPPKPAAKPPPKPPPKPTPPPPKPPATVTVTQTVKPACAPSTVVSTSTLTNTITVTSTKTVVSEVTTTTTSTLTVTVTATPTDPPDDDPDSDYSGQVPFNVYEHYKDYHGATRRIKNF